MKKQKRNPAEILGELGRAKMGVAVGSQLEGGKIVYDDDKKKKKKQEKKKPTSKQISKLIKTVM